MHLTNIIKPCKRDKENQSILFQSKIIFNQQETEAAIYSDMIVFGDQCIQFEFDLKFGIKEGKVYFQDYYNSVQFILPGKDEKEWQNVLKRLLMQRGFQKTYAPIKKIGKGSFASVYLVKKRQNQEQYAVKCFSKSSAYSEQDGKQCLIKQIEIMRQLDHKNLMKLEEVYETQNSIYIVVELLEGGRLQDLKNQLSNDDIKQIMRQLLEGVESMHQKGIMHRDLKFQNIILRKKQGIQCVIADFGLAEREDQEHFLFVRCGTPGYVAPQVMNIKDLSTKYGCACDIFSLGIIFHILMLGHNIIEGKQYDDIVKANRACNFDFNLEKYKIFPEQFVSLLKQMLQIDPNQRISASTALKHPYFQQKKQSEEMIQQPKKAENPKKFPVLNFTHKRDKTRMLKDSCLQLKMRKDNLWLGKTETVKNSQQTKISLMNTQNPAKIIKISKFSKLPK